MNISNFDESNSSENQQLPTFKDPKGCLDITTNHQKDDDIKKIVILHQDILMDEQKDDDANKRETLHQNNPKECQDITIGIKKIMVLQEEPKGCQDITIDTNNIVILHQVSNQDDHHQDHDVDVVNETIVIQHVEEELVQEDIQHVEDDVVNDIIVALHPIVVENEVVVLQEDDNDGFRTPTSLESKIQILTCPGAPRRNYSGFKRKASSPLRRGERNVRVWNDYRHRDTTRF